jgi:thiol:disulfide interchange protein DsbD
MVPILSALILGEQQRHHPFKAFTLAVAYVLGMATTYAALGAIVGSMGARIQVEWQNPWVLTTTAGFLVLFAGMLLHDRPQAWLSRLSGVFHRISQALPRGEYIGVALLGMVSSLVISPCVTPPLVGALTFITLEGNMWFGSLALFMLGLGMGLPLLAVTWLGTAILPKRGPWMQGVKHFLALLLVAMAIDLLTRFLANSTGLILYGILAVAVGVWLKPFYARRGMARLWQAIAWVMMVLGALWITGGAMGNETWYAPLRSPQEGPQGLHFTVVTSPDALNQALAKARDLHQPAFVDFYADWCVSCVQMEKTVFTHESVKALMKQYALIKVDLTESTKDTQALLKTWQLFGPPAYLFFDSNGHELTAARINGEMNEEDFLAYLEHIRPSSANPPASPKN